MIRCFNHGKVSTMVCTFKTCQHRTLCADCIVTHPKNHLANILPIREFDPSSYAVPRTIAIRQRMAMLQNHLIQTREQRKSDVRRLQKQLIEYFTDELDIFLKSIVLEIEKFYNVNHNNVASVIQNCEDHLNKLNQIINGEVDDSRKFDFLLDLQDKLIQVIVPELTQQAEQFSKQSMCADLLINTNYEKYLQVALEKAFTKDNFLITEKKPVTIEEINYDSLALFTAKQNSNYQKDNNFYKAQISPYLHQFEGSYKTPNSAEFNPKPPPEAVFSNALPFEVFLSSQKHLNTVLQGHFDIVTSIAILSLKQVATGGGEGVLKFWDIDSQMGLGTIEAHKGEIWCLCPIYEEEIAKQIASGGNDKVVHVWNVQYMTLELTLIGHLDFVKSICYLKQYNYLCTGGGDYKIKVWNRDKCMYTIEDAHKNMIRTIIPIEDNSFASSGDSNIRVWVGYKGQKKMEFSHGADVTSLLELPEQQLASGGMDKLIIIWNVKGGFKIQKLQAHHDGITCLGYHKYLFSGGLDKTLRLWDIQEGKQIKSIKMHQEQISCLSISPYRELIMTGSWDKRIRIVSLDYLLQKNNQIQIKK